MKKTSKLLEEILKLNRVNLGSRPSPRRNEEVFVRNYIESDNWFLSIVEDGWCDFGIKSAISNTSETIYLSHKITHSNFSIRRKTVATDSMNLPRHTLLNIIEELNVVTLEYKHGETVYSEVFELTTETTTTSKTILVKKEGAT